MSNTMSRLLVLAGVVLLGGTYALAAVAQPIFFDDFEDRVKDQALIGNNWTWYDQWWFDNTSCSGDPSGGYGPWSDGNGDDYPAENRNYWTASADFGYGDSYFRAGLEVPAWEGALGNMLRVYGNQYFGDVQCERVLIFQEYSLAEAGTHRFSFEVAQDQFGAPANGEYTAAFVKVLKSSDGSFWTLDFVTVATEPPPATSPGNASTRFQYIAIDIPPEWVGELLQFGFYNDVSKPLGQSWATSAALYDNVTLSTEEAGEAQYSVTTEWTTSDSDLKDLDLNTQVKINCETPIVGFALDNGTDPVSESDFELVVTLDDGDTVTAFVETVNGTTQCSASQNLVQPGVKESASAACSGRFLSDGGAATCTFSNTLFYEGIPALSEWSKLLLAVMLLGAGLVVVRRFA